jgi:hypothetical protein
LNVYLHNVASQLEVPEKEESKLAIGEDYGDPPKLAVVQDERTHFLYLAFACKSYKYAIRTDLEKLIDKLVPPASRNPFDILLLSKSDGTVIFQKSSSGLNVAQIDGHNEVAKKGKPATQLSVDSLSQASGFEEVTLEGAPYRLYSQPLTISFAQAETYKKGEKNAATEPIRPWVLSGLVRADRFRSESQSISYKYVLWLSAVLLMVFAVYPFLRLRISTYGERLRARQVVITTVAACVIAATVTFALLDLTYWWHFDRSAENQMQDLSGAIDSTFRKEKDKAFAQLDDLVQYERAAHSLT